MQMFESAAARILEPLSQILQKPLSLIDGQSPEARNAFAIRLTSPRVAIVSTDGKPFTDHERRLIDELFGVVRIAGRARRVTKSSNSACSACSARTSISW